MKSSVLLPLFFVLAHCGQSAVVPDAGSDASADVGSDVDNGAPSTDYPAPHPPLPQLVNASKGPVLTSPNVYLIFYPSYQLETDLDSFAQAMSTTQDYWNTTTSEYGVGPISYKGKIDLTDTPPTTISQTDLQTWVAGEIQSGAFGTPDPEAIYTVVYPSTTTITQPNPVNAVLGNVSSCQSFSGYHDNASVTLGDAGATSFAYAVIPTCGPLPTITETLSHEWVEASTDPFLTSSGTFTLAGGPDAAFYSPDGDHIIWSLLGGGEAGDLCGTDGTSAYISVAAFNSDWVQRTWSNASAQGSHDPCVPEISGAFFDSAPVLPETVTFDSALTGSVTTQGVTIAQGQSKTIEVDLFSDGDTGGPWTVSAQDLLSTYYGSYGVPQTLTFSWDRTTGQNGEKLHLTITVTGPSIVSGAHAFMITSKLPPKTMIWPGLVVE